MSDGSVHWLVPVACVLVGACTSTAPATDPEAESALPAVESNTPPRERHQGVETSPRDPSFDVVTKVCESGCAGTMARIRVFRDDEGHADRLRYDGDLHTCSHPPRVYFDASGERTLTIPNEPVSADSKRAAELSAQQDREVAGLVEAELLGCPAVDECKPERTKGFRSEFPCRADVDCMTCECGPVSRDEWRRRGEEAACTIAGEECMATNPVCCGGRCMLAR